MVAGLFLATWLKRRRMEQRTGIQSNQPPKKLPPKRPTQTSAPAEENVTLKKDVEVEKDLSETLTTQSADLEKERQERIEQERLKLEKEKEEARVRAKQEREEAKIRAERDRLAIEKRRQEEAKRKREEKEKNLAIRKAREQEAKQRKEEKKQNKKPLNKKLLAILIIAIAIVVLALTLFIVLKVNENKRNNTKLETPTVEVAQLGANGTFLVATETKGATKYEFVVTNVSGESKTYTSTEHYLEFGSYLSQAGSYSVKVRVFGKGAGATSDFSEVETFENYVALDAPKVYVNNMDLVSENSYKTNKNSSDDTLSWDAVPNAVKYYINYSADVTSDTIYYIECEAKVGLNTFDLNNIYIFGAGLYQVSIIAVPEAGGYYTNSEYDKIISIACYSQENAPINVSFDSTSKVLTFDLLNGAYFDGDFELVISYYDYSSVVYCNMEGALISNGTYEEGGEQYTTYRADLTQVLSGSVKKIGVTTLKTNDYSTNSSTVFWGN